MNRQQVKELLPIIQAFAEDKEIQAYNPLTKEWYDKYESIDFNSESPKYRIKPESKYRPFKDGKECFEEMQKHQPFGWIKDASKMYNITIIRDDGIIVNTSTNSNWFDFERSLNLKFIDGELFGIKE